jgi:hypothetical protein
MVHAKNMSWKKFIQETGASTYCGACYLDLKNHFFYYKYQKKFLNRKIYYYLKIYENCNIYRRFIFKT